MSRADLRGAWLVTHGIRDSRSNPFRAVARDFGICDEYAKIRTNLN